MDAGSEGSLLKVFSDDRDLGRFQIKGFINRGNSGEVYNAVELENGRDVAIKVFIPFFEQQQLSLFRDADPSVLSKILSDAHLAADEYRFLSQIQHPFIVPVFANGKAQLSKGEAAALRQSLGLTRNPVSQQGRRLELPYVVTALVPGLPIDKALKNMEPHVLDPNQIARTLFGVAQALEHLHIQHRYLHADVKPANVLLRTSDALPVVIDFALCKNLNFEAGMVRADEVLARLQVDWSLTPDDQLSNAHPLHKLMRAGGTRGEVRDSLFPWLDFFQYGKLLEAVRDELANFLPSGDAKYVRELTALLTSWERVRQLGHGDLTRLVGRIGAAHTYHLVAGDVTQGSTIITLPNSRKVGIPTELERITRNASFNRLARIHQLSLLPLTHPGASHTRLLHAYDSLRIAQRFTAALTESPMFRLIYSPDDVIRLSALALLHDINHFPLLHFFQESELSELDHLDVYDIVCDGVETGEKKSDQPSIYDLLSGLGIDRGRFQMLIAGDWKKQNSDSGNPDRLTNSLLKSGIDIDKLSYLPLDSELSGLGMTSSTVVDELIAAATVVDVEIDDIHGPHLAFRESALAQVEAFMSARLDSYQRLYWSPRNRAMMALFLDVLRRLADGGQSIGDFIKVNILASDLQLIQKLEALYVDTFGESSGLPTMMRDPGVFPILIMQSRDFYHQLLHRRAPRMELESALADALANHIGLEDRGPHQILIDLPERHLDDGGRVFIVERDGGWRDIRDLSTAARGMSERYARLSETVSIFASGTLGSGLGDRLTWDRSSIELIIDSVIRGGVSQIR